MITIDDLRRYVAPCGLVCRTCTSFGEGPVAQHSRELQHWLEGFAPMAQAFSSFMPALSEYPAFERVLACLAGGSCAGCREGGCPMPDCHVGPCAKSRGLDWCWQCAEFPCADPGFDGQLREVWLRANERMRKLGMDAFWAEAGDKPHYGG